MALSSLPKPTSTTLPGVPTLKVQNIQPATISTVLGKVQGEIWRALTTESNWGIFSPSGEPLILADSVIEVGYTNSKKVAQHPVAGGSFASYNKVDNPFETTIRLCKGSGLKALGEIGNVLQNGIGSIGKGALNARSEFLDTIDELSNSLELVHVVTPEKTYTHCNIEKYTYRREQSNGAHMLIVDIVLVEVRETETRYMKSDTPVTTDNAKQPEAKPPENNGKVQPQPINNGSWMAKAGNTLNRWAGRFF